MQQRINEMEIDALLITGPANRAYLSGFTGSAGYLAVSRNSSFLVTDFRYAEQAQAQSPGIELVLLKKDFSSAIVSLVEREGWKNFGFEEEHLTCINYGKLSENTGIPLVPVRGEVENLRSIKDGEELDKIRRSAAFLDGAFEEILAFICPGIREKDIALELEYIMRKKGADGPSFRYIVASGYRSAWPHGEASEKIIGEGELIVIDFGVFWQGYASDMTRTVATGPLNGKQREIYEVVLRARQAALEGLKAHLKGSEVDKIARDIIGDAGFSEYFGHGLGHGIGLAAHEAPTLSPAGENTLLPGMVVTVEPGVYIPGLGGVRIEDMALISEGGNELLTSAPRELIVL